MSERGKIFKEAPIIAPMRSWFDMSFDHTLSMNMGDIVPVTCMECLPGDILKVKAGNMARFSPMLAPVLGKVNLFSYWFYVRNRDIWTDFDKFITNNDQRKTWQQQSTFVPPVMPKIQPLRTLVDASLNGDTSAYTETEKTDWVNLSFPTLVRSRYYALRLSIKSYADGNTKWLEPKIYAGDSLSAIHIENGTLVVLFRPNKADFTGDKTLAGAVFDRFDNDTSEPFDSISINPFGRGNLFDYLGLSIDGLYNQQLTRFDDIFDNYLVGYGSSFFTLADFCDVDETGFDLKTFLNDHFVAFVGITNGSVGSSNDPSSMHIRFVDLWNDNISDGGNYLHITGNGINYSDAQLNSGISELPLRAYRFIYDEYFRDQNYIPVNENTDFASNGVHSPIGYTDDHIFSWQRYLSLERKAWEHDPYTSSLPGPQRGDAVRYLSNPLLTTGDNITVESGTQYNHTLITSDGRAFAAQSSTTGSSFSASSIEVDLSMATIENFRWANAMQKYLEKKARTGGRYYEYLKGIWNQEVADAKLNRPIYLDGQKNPVQISEVLQTSASEVSSDQPLGQLAGRGISVGSDGYFEFEAPDYGFLFQVVSVVPRVAYQTGLAPMFTRESYLDYPLPDFAKLGEEVVRQSELWYSCDEEEDNRPFGYQSRYYQWKYNRDIVSSELATQLDFWTFARKFDDKPVMGQKFIEVVPDYRQFAVTSRYYDHIQASFFNDIQVNRALPEFGVPTL